MAAYRVVMDGAILVIADDHTRGCTYDQNKHMGRDNYEAFFSASIALYLTIQNWHRAWKLTFLESKCS
jgi:hypothetical protein